MSVPSAVQSSITAEARGDWSNFRGDYYHLLYASATALSEGVTVEFFSGNDLLAKQATDNADLWVQLKNDAPGTDWTVTRILRDPSLIANFLMNALTSEVQGRTWDIRLVSPASVRGDEITTFFTSPGSFRPRRRRGQPPLPSLEDVLTGIVDAALTDWNGRFARGHVDDVTRHILTRLIASRRHSPDELKLVVEREVLLRNNDPSVLLRVTSAVVGAMASAVGNSALAPLAINRSWLAHNTGFPFLETQVLFDDVARACDVQVSARLAVDWDATRSIGRVEFTNAVEDFLTSDKPLFVLAGESGSGKTWALGHIAAMDRQGSIRVFLPADELLVNLVPAVARDFAAAAPPDSNAEQIIRRLVNAAALPAAGPLLVIGDDLGVHGTPFEDASSVIGLAQEAQRRQAKLVLSMRLRTWQRLCRDSRIGWYMHQRSQGMGNSTSPSFELVSLNDSELDMMVKLRRGASAATDSLVQWLKRPEHALVRNPYLLRLFLEQYEAAPQNPVLQDELLDAEFGRAVMDVSLRTGLDHDIVGPAIEALVKRYWDQRETGLTSQEVLDLLEKEASSFGGVLLQSLRARDILSQASSLRASNDQSIAFANPLFLERAIARKLLAASRDLFATVSELEPGRDDGVVTSMVRSAPAEGLLQALERVLRQIPAWTPALVRGLAQRPAGVWSIPAFLSAIGNLPETAYRREVLAALGLMSYHSAEARQWIHDLWLDEEFEEAFDGQLALSAAAAINPTWCLEEVSVRLRREMASSAVKDDEKAERATGIRRSLDPLRHIASFVGAKGAIEILRRIRRWDRKPNEWKQDVRLRYDDTADEVRGAIAVSGAPQVLEGLKAELRGGSKMRRQRAARAARTVAFERPDESEMRGALLAALAKERRDWNSFLSTAFVYARKSPDGVAEALRESQALQSWRGSLALIIAGLLAEHDPSVARALLPMNLDGFDSNAHPMLLEPLAYAWTVVGTSDPNDSAARSTLEALALVDASSFAPDLQANGLRGKALATLGRILMDIPDCAGAIRNANIIFHDLADDTGEGFAYVEMSEVCGLFCHEIVSHPACGGLIATLTEAIKSGFTHPVSPLQRRVMQWQFRAQNLCTDEMAALAVATDDAIAWVQQLPRDWPALRVSRKLISAERSPNAAAKLGCEIASEHANHLGNVSQDRDEFLFLVESRPDLQVPTEDIVHQVRRYGGSNAGHLRHIGATGNVDILSELHARVTDGDGLSFIWEWSGGATDWPSVLLGRVFRRCLTSDPITDVDVHVIVSQLREALDALPNSELSRLYGQILDRIVAPGVSTACIVVEGEGLLDKSQRLALAITASNDLEGGWQQLLGLLEESGGYLLDPHHRLQSGTVHRGGGAFLGTFWLPPLPRLALAVAGLRTGAGDLGHKLQERWKAVELRRLASPIVDILRPRFEHHPEEWRERRLSEARSELDSLVEQFPDSAIVRYTGGHIRLVTADLPGARDWLEASLNLPTIDFGLRPNTHYDLACTLCRQGLIDEALRELETAVLMDPRLKWDARDDADFATIAGSQQFLEITAHPPPRPNFLLPVAASQAAAGEKSRSANEGDGNCPP